MGSFDRPSYGGVQSHRDFPDSEIRQSAEECAMTERISKFSRDNPITAIVSVFGAGLIIGAGAAVVLSLAKRQSSHERSLGSMKSRLSESVASAIPRSVRNSLQRS